MGLYTDIQQGKFITRSTRRCLLLGQHLAFIRWSTLAYPQPCFVTAVSVLTSHTTTLQITSRARPTGNASWCPSLLLARFTQNIVTSQDELWMPSLIDCLSTDWKHWSTHWRESGFLRLFHAVRTGLLKTCHIGVSRSKSSMRTDIYTVITLDRSINGLIYATTWN